MFGSDLPGFAAGGAALRGDLRRGMALRSAGPRSGTFSLDSLSLVTVLAGEKNRHPPDTSRRIPHCRQGGRYAGIYPLCCGRGSSPLGCGRQPALVPEKFISGFLEHEFRAGTYPLCCGRGSSPLGCGRQPALVPEKFISGFLEHEFRAGTYPLCCGRGSSPLGCGRQPALGGTLFKGG
jgi:hypothetical protein